MSSFGPNEPTDRSTAVTGPAVVIAGGGPAGLRLAGELALADVDIAERFPTRHNYVLAGRPEVEVSEEPERGIRDDGHMAWAAAGAVLAGPGDLGAPGGQGLVHGGPVCHVEATVGPSGSACGS